MSDRRGSDWRIDHARGFAPQSSDVHAAGLTPSAYNQMEKGGTWPSIDSAITICDAHGPTLDRIYLGDMSGLRLKLVQAIKALHKLRGKP